MKLLIALNKGLANCVARPATGSGPLWVSLAGPCPLPAFLPLACPSATLRHCQLGLLPWAGPGRGDVGGCGFPAPTAWPQCLKMHFSGVLRLCSFCRPACGHPCQLPPHACLPAAAQAVRSWEGGPHLYHTQLLVPRSCRVGSARAPPHRHQPSAPSLSAALAGKWGQHVFPVALLGGSLWMPGGTGRKPGTEWVRGEHLISVV